MYHVCNSYLIPFCEISMKLVHSVWTRVWTFCEISMKLVHSVWTRVQTEWTSLLYRYTIFCLSRHQLNIWIVSVFCYQHSPTSFCLNTCFQFFGVEPQGHTVNSMFNSATFYIPTVKYEGSNFSTSSLVIFCFYQNHPVGYEVAISLWFWFTFP